MQNKDGETVLNALKECFKVMGHPQSVYSDDEGALNDKILQKYLKHEGITHNTTLTHANVAERMIRTLKKMIRVLKPVLDKYNKQVKHSTT